MSPCLDCGIAMSTAKRRPYVSPTPGTRHHAAKGLCTRCYYMARYGGNRHPEPADWVVIHRVVAGGTARTNSAERRAIVDTLTARGLSAAAIAARLGITQRSVVRIRTRDKRSEAA